MSSHLRTTADLRQVTVISFTCLTEKDVNNMFTPRSVNTATGREQCGYTHRDQGTNAIG
jgi:hypothetical protein